MKRALKALAVAVLVALAGPALAEERWRTLPEPAPMPTPNESGYADVNDIQMFYQVFGSGEPVLLIHGGLGHGDLWSSQIADLSKDHKVIVPDSRGHGRSTRNDEPFAYNLMASDYLALLDYLKIDKTALVGWSDGHHRHRHRHEVSGATDKAVRACRQCDHGRDQSVRRQEQDLRRLY